jgi:hypothetical protein
LIRAQVNPLSIAELVLFWVIIGEAYKQKGGIIEFQVGWGLKILLILGLLGMMVINIRLLVADWYFKAGDWEKARVLNSWSEVY